MQQGLREPSHVARETTPDASPRTSRWRLMARVAAMSVVFGGLFAILIPHGAGSPLTAARAATTTIIAFSAIVSALLLWRVLRLWPVLAANRWIGAVIVAGLQTPIVALVVWLTAPLAGDLHRQAMIPLGILAYSAAICLLLNVLTQLLTRETRLLIPSKSPARAVRFLERLPLKLRGAELWAISSEDHYLRLRTSKGEALILMRISDALTELAGLDGLQVHRCWWVARGAVVAVRRGGGKAILTLKDGAEVPVSRRFAKTIREANWLPVVGVRKEGPPAHVPT